MFEGILGRDSLFWIVDEDLSQKVEELFVERSIGGNKFLRLSVFGVLMMGKFLHVNASSL
jgi:hypothetical protein